MIEVVEVAKNMILLTILAMSKVGLSLTVIFELFCGCEACLRNGWIAQYSIISDNIEEDREMRN